MSWLSRLALVALIGALVSCGTNSDTVDLENWPKRPITISCFAAAGGGTDVVCQLMAKEMGEELGVKINVVHRTGGGGAAAITHVVQSKRDGYQWGGFADSLLTKSVLGTSDATAKDWACYVVAGAPGVLSVAANSPYQTIEELIAAAKAAPGSIKVGASITGCIWHTKLLALEKATDTSFKFVPYQGSAPSQVAALSGELDVVLTSISEQSDLIDGGKLRPLAMIEMEPFTFANGRTIPAAGVLYPKIGEVPVSQFLCIALPIDTPQLILDKISAAFEKVMASDAVKEFAETRNLTLLGHHSEQALAENLKAEQVWTWLLHDLGIAVKSPEVFGIARP